MFSTAVGVVLGALSGVLAVHLVRAIPALRRHRAIATGVLIAVLFATGIQVIAPAIHAWKRRRDVDVLLRDDSLYSSILADYPDLRQPLRTELLKAQQHPSPREASLQGVAKLLGPVFPKYVPRATDEAILEFVGATVATLEQLRRRDPDRCYGFLYPARGPATVPAEDEGIDTLLGSMTKLVVSARGRPASVPSQDAVEPTLEAVFEDLASRHGDDVQLLREPQARTVDRHKVCALAIDLYSTITKLPRAESVPVLRHMFSGS